MALGKKTNPFPGGAPINNREPSPAPATWAAIRDESLYVEPGSALDHSGWRTSAVPAGARGAVFARGDQLFEGDGTPFVANILTIVPDNLFTPLPDNRVEIKSAIEDMARRGYNAARLHFFEAYLMANRVGAVNFDPDRLDKFFFLISCLKASGIYVIPNVAAYTLFTDMQGASNRYVYTATNNCKARIYTEADIRANWKAGCEVMYCTVNPYTGRRLVDDPACLAIGLYNESSTTFCASFTPQGEAGPAFPAVWKARTVGSTPAAKTWGEWLADPTMDHGYADIAALNASWGAAHADFAAAAAAAVPPLNTSIPTTNQAVDATKYAHFLEADLDKFYVAAMAAWGYRGLSFAHEMYPQLGEVRGAASGAANKLSAWHGYMTINDGTSLTQANNPIWNGTEGVFAMTPWCSDGKPRLWVEFGWPWWSKYRAQFPVIAAFAAAHKVAGMSMFSQGNIFRPAYLNDTSAAGDRFSKLYEYHSPGDPTTDFIRVMMNAVFLRGDVSAMTGTKLELTLNDRHTGVNPRNAARIGREYSYLLQALYLASYFGPVDLRYTADTTDDSLAATWTPKSLQTLLSEALARGTIAADHPSLLSANANSGNIVSVATTGSVGGFTATVTAPVLELPTGITIANGDRIVIPSMTGSGAGWPGTSLRNAVIVLNRGTGNYVQAISGLNLTSAVGTFTAGTFAELGNEIESGHRQIGLSRRLKRCHILTDRTLFFSQDGATIPATLGPLTITAMTAAASMGVVSLDGLPIASSKRLLVGLVADAQNTGQTFTDGTRTTVVNRGSYPIEITDATLSMTMALGAPRDWSLYRLARSGRRVAQETIAEVDVDAGRIAVTLRTGVTYPSVFFELVRP